MRTAILAVLALLPTATPAAEPTTGTSVQPGERQATGRVVIADGHIDMGPRFVNGKWTIQIRDDTQRPPVWRNTEDVVLHAVDAAKVQVPDDQQFAFLGEPGAHVWVLPQVQRPGVLWPGWNTQDPQVATTVNREVTWRLRGVTGPGRMVLFVNGDFGAPQVLFDSARPYPQQTGIDLNTHAHGNWTFAAPGTYLLDVEMSARTLDARQVADRRLVRVFVGNADPKAAFAAAPPPGFVPGGTTETSNAADNNDGVPIGALLGGGAIALVLGGGLLTLLVRRRTKSAPGSTPATEKGS